MCTTVACEDTLGDDAGAPGEYIQRHIRICVWRIKFVRPGMFHVCRHRFGAQLVEDVL
jgi:hypothetical protein